MATIKLCDVCHKLQRQNEAVCTVSATIFMCDGWELDPVSIDLCQEHFQEHCPKLISLYTERSKRNL